MWLLARFHHGRVLRRVHTDLTAAGESDLRDRSPARFLDGRTLHALRFEGFHLGAKVVAHEVQLGSRGIRGVHRGLRGRQAEDEPPTSRVDVLEPENIGEEGAIARRGLD